MSFTCNKIKKENDKIISDFEKNFEKNIARYELENKKYRQEGELDYVDSYVATIYSNLYVQINQTIILLDIKKYAIIEIPILISQLKELYRLFFDYLETSKYKSDYWKLLEINDQQYFDYEYSFIEPDYFYKDYIFDLICRFDKDFSTIPMPNRKVKDHKNYINETWFEIGLEFANGNIDKLVKQGKSQVEIANILFKNKKIKPSSYRPWVNYTITKANNDKNIFTRSNSEDELKKVYDYCIENNIDIAAKFIADCSQYDIKF